MKQKQPHAAFLCLHSLHEGRSYCSDVVYFIHTELFCCSSLDCWRKPEKTNADTNMRSRPQDLLLFDIMMHLLKMHLCCTNKPCSYKLEITWRRLIQLLIQLQTKNQSGRDVSSLQRLTAQLVFHFSSFSYQTASDVANKLCYPL